MKIEIADPILNQARKLAAREGTTVKALVEPGLRRIIPKKRRRPFACAARVFKVKA